MSLRLTDFGTYNEVEHVSFFTFTVKKFSDLKTNKISRAFSYAGHLWKLQVRKVNGHLGLFLRWYGTKMRLETHVKCCCKTGILFTVINHFDSKHSVTEGDLAEDDVYDRPGSGIGYGEVIELRHLDNIPGYLLSNTLVVQIRLKVKSTTFIDKLQIATRPDRIFVRGLRFPFHGAEWSMILFPAGEKEDSSEEESMNEESMNEEVTQEEASNEEEEIVVKKLDDEIKIKKSIKANRSTLYLSRELSKNTNDTLRHRVKFLLFVVGGPCFEIVQNFHEKQSSVFGTGHLMNAEALQKLGANGVIRVGVTFLEVTPYFNFGYDLSDRTFEGVSFVDQRDIPWLLKISDDDDNNKELLCSLKLDPESKSKRIKALATREKRLKIIWHVKIINFKDVEMSLDVCSEHNSPNDCGTFVQPCEEHSVVLPIKKSQVSNSESPYRDDDGQSCILISTLDANFIHNLEDVGMKIEEVAEIARIHKIETLEERRDNKIREQIWQMSMSHLEKEKEDILNNSAEELEKKDDALRQKDFFIRSLEEKLCSVEGYVQSLESNSLEEIDKFNKSSISKLLINCKPDAGVVQEMDILFNFIAENLKISSDDVVSVICAGSHGEGTLIRTESNLDIVVFIKGDLECSMKTGDMSNCLEFIRKTLESSENIENRTEKNSFVDFIITPISLKCNHDGIAIEIFPTKNWLASGYHVIYEASVGLTKDSLKCFITATAERRSSFVQQQDEQCKDLIRLLKTWSNGMNWESQKQAPSFYLLSLLIVRSYEIIKSTNAFKTPSFCKEVLNEMAIISNQDDFRIEWDEFYQPEAYDIECTTAPLLRDPVLPSHNVAESGIEDWTQFREELPIWLTSLCP